MKKDFTEQFHEIFKDLEKDTLTASNEAVKLCGKEAVKRLKSTGGYKDHDSKGFRKSWKVEIEKNRLGDKAIVYNTNAGQTTWLEYGHVRRNGGRTQAFPHIGDVNEAMPKIFASEFERSF